MIKNKYVAFGLFLVCFLGMWNLLDFLYSMFISRSSYHFGIANDAIVPIVTAVVVGYLVFLREKK